MSENKIMDNDEFEQVAGGILKDKEALKRYCERLSKFEFTCCACGKKFTVLGDSLSTVGPRYCWECKKEKGAATPLQYMIKKDNQQTE